MSESHNALDFRQPPDQESANNDTISLAPPSHPSTAQTPTAASNAETLTPQSAATDYSLCVRLEGAQGWGHMKSRDSARVRTYGTERSIGALTELDKVGSAATTIAAMVKYVESQTGDLRWTPSEEKDIKDRLLIPTNTLMYRAWEPGIMRTLQNMADGHNKEKNDSEVGISVESGVKAQMRKSLVPQRQIDQIASEFRLESAKSGAETQ